MMKNMSQLDRVIRLLIVAAIAAAYLLGHLGGTVAEVLSVVAIVFLLTSLFSTCPAYSLLGLSTRRHD